MLLIASFGLRDSLVSTNELLFGEQYTYQGKVIFKDILTDDDRKKVETLSNNDGQWLYENSAEIKTAYFSEIGFFTVLDEGYYVRVNNLQGNSVAFPSDGCVISKKLAASLSLKKNDTFQLKLMGNDKQYNMRIVDIISAPYPQGVMVSSEFWGNIGEKFIPTTYLIGNTADYNKVKSFIGISEGIKLSEQLNSVNEVMDSITKIMLLLTVASIFLIVTILYNIGTLNFSERKKEYATMRVLGYRSKEIFFAICRDTIPILILGWMLGVPAGLFFLRIYVNTIVTNTFDYVPNISVSHILISSLITIGCTFWVNILINAKVSGLDLTKVLKTLE